MMLGVSGLMGTSGDAAADESGGASGGSSDLGASTSLPAEDIGGGGGGGNRWPRQETLALLRIRSDMDAAFRDSSLKGPLWEEISRKMAELGFQRSAKKCKEKFENVYKYHKRTKDGRASKSDGKTYRFFDQLEALENTPPPPPPRRPMPLSTASLPSPLPIASSTVPSTSPTPLSVLPPIQTSNTNNPVINSSSPFQSPPLPPQTQPQPQALQFPSSLRSGSTSSSSTSSDEDIQRRRGKKRKWKDFFERLMKDVLHKQEDLQKKFIDTLERRERDRVAREEAWRMQEMARMNRDHEFLVQERSIAAAKDAAVIAFLQKVTDQNNLQIPIPTTIAAMQPHPPPGNPNPPQLKQQTNQPQPQPPPPPPPLELPSPPKAAQAQQVTPVKTDNGGGGDNSMSASSSRWPKAEVQALINLRTRLDMKYQENGPKGPLWEEISSAMGKMGYNRSSKRCKEKWENINKYFKKVKESSKKRPEDSKTCPYFHQLDAIYKERAKHDAVPFAQGQGYAINPEPIMARPEQQWPLPNPPAALPIDNDSENNDHEDDDDGDDDDDEDEGGGNYEMVANKHPSSAAE